MGSVGQIEKRTQARVVGLFRDRLIDWKDPANNHFAIAEEVTVKGPTPRPAPSARKWCRT